MKIAFVYDRVNKFGGAERVLLALHKIWPKAPLFTAVYDPQGASWAKVFQVIPSFVNKFPWAKSHHEIYPWLMPFAFESLNFDEFEVVISITSAEAKGILTKPKTLHLCYCLTPTRYLWSGFKHYLTHPRYGLINPLAKIFLPSLMKKMQIWDKVASSRPDYYLAISKTVQSRIKKYYGKESEIIYPPVDTERFQPKAGPSWDDKSSIKKEYFLVVSRLVSYKRIDLIIEAFNQLGLPLKIIGDGTERKNLQKKAKANIEFLGQQLTDDKLISYYQNCLALVFAGEEDLGLVALEAQACQKPVLAYKIGGVGETVIDGKTGILFYPQTTKALLRAISLFKPENFNRKDCQHNSQKYSEEIFKIKIKKFVEEKWQRHKLLI